MQKKSADGFTLLELIISLTILAVLVVIVFGALRVGIRAWEKGEGDVEAHQRNRVVFDLMKRQICSLSTMKKIEGDEGASFLLNGDSTSLEFLSHVHVLPGDKGLVHVKYRVFENEGESSVRLSFFEEEILFTENRGENRGAQTEEVFHVLIPAARDIHFEYLCVAAKEEPPQWLDQWDGTTEMALPLAVRVSMRQLEDGPELKVIARLAQDRD